MKIDVTASQNVKGSLMLYKRQSLFYGRHGTISNQKVIRSAKTMLQNSRVDRSLVVNSSQLASR
jgi:hypothetical protein